jgi:hypothetical protein
VSTLLALHNQKLHAFLSFFFWFWNGGSTQPADPGSNMTTIYRRRSYVYLFLAVFPVQIRCIFVKAAQSLRCCNATQSYNHARNVLFPSHRIGSDRIVYSYARGQHVPPHSAGADRRFGDGRTHGTAAACGADRQVSSMCRPRAC